MVENFSVHAALVQFLTLKGMATTIRWPTICREGRTWPCDQVVKYPA